MASTFLKPTYLPHPWDDSGLIKQRRCRDHRFKQENSLDSAVASRHYHEHVSDHRLRYAQPEMVASMSLSVLTSPLPDHRCDEPRVIGGTSLLSYVDIGASITFLPTPGEPSLMDHHYPVQKSTQSHHISTNQPHRCGVAKSKGSEATAKDALPTAVPPHLRSASSTGKQSSSGFGAHNDHIKVHKKLAALDVKADELRTVALAVAKPDPGVTSKTHTSAEHARKQTLLEGVQLTESAYSEHKKQPRATMGSIAPIDRRGHCGRAKANIRGACWPKHEETRPDPNCSEIKWNSDATQNAHTSSVDSNWADFGLDGIKQKRGLGNGSFQLADWSRDLAHAPLDWDAQPPFCDPRLVEQINSWRAKIEEEEAWSIHQEIDSASLAHSEELVPRYWVPLVIGRQGSRTFWNDLLNSRVPLPVDDDDLNGVMPWWDRYLSEDNECVLLKAAANPEIRGIDPDETLDERLARENDGGSAFHAQNRRRREAAKRKAQQGRKKGTGQKLQKYAEQTAGTYKEKIWPNCNMFVRSAQPADMVAIRNIYNHYVEFTCFTPEIERRTTADMTQRYNDILSNRLPFLVACERGGKIGPRRKEKNYNNGEDITHPDRIIGFAFADDYNDLTGMYRFTTEVEVYTHKMYRMKGVAKCLLDKLIALLDPWFQAHGGFAIEGDELEGVGPSRTIQHIIMNISYDSSQHLEWMKRWVVSSLGFEQVGNLPEIGNKLGKNVNLAVFLRKTGAHIDPANPPVRMKYPTT